MIVTVNGDIMSSAAPVLVDPVNCAGVAGAGLALLFRRRFPAAHLAYVEACRSGALAPGRPVVAADGGRTIVFLPTKRHWRDPSLLEDVASGLTALRAMVTDNGWAHIAVPALGCGLGCLSWPTVAALIVNVLGDVPGTVEVYPPRLP